MHFLILGVFILTPFLAFPRSLLVHRYPADAFIMLGWSFGVTDNYGRELIFWGS
jgi:hypothetical protein